METKTTEVSLISRVGFWCAPTECGGQSLRTVIRQGLPLVLGFTAGTFAHRLLHTLFEEEPHLLNIGISVLVGLATALTVAMSINRLLECCWHEHYQDNYRELNKTDLESIGVHTHYQTL